MQNNTEGLYPSLSVSVIFNNNTSTIPAFTSVSVHSNIAGSTEERLEHQRPRKRAYAGALSEKEKEGMGGEREGEGEKKNTTQTTHMTTNTSDNNKRTGIATNGVI